ncbi:MAG: U32 family peptidase [Lachnospiraceae bacterium]|nr:U32 family peptidase [Lachnospiraceae bacterium]
MSKGSGRKPELLIPAGSLEVLKVAVDYGGDAVYIGGEAFSLRAKAKNFSAEEMAEGIAYAHAHGVRLYVTANILAHEADLEEAAAYFEELKALGPDALIIADAGLFAMARSICPDIPVHISTQASVSNSLAASFWFDMGASRVVLARELSLREIAKIREAIPPETEIECFVHGAMCISYSGRCLLSAALTGREANHGACTHPCRWKYHVMEETRPGAYFPVEENERGTYVFNSKDLCMIDHIPELVEAGIDSFKIEGRMKTALYVAMVARAYRRAIDLCFASEEEYRAAVPELLQEVCKATFRPYSTGFYFGKPDTEGQNYEDLPYITGYTYLGCVESLDEKGMARITQKNKFSVGDGIEIMKKDGRDIPVQVLAMYNAEGEAVESCPHASEEIWLQLSEVPECGDILRVQGGREG